MIAMKCCATFNLCIKTVFATILCSLSNFRDQLAIHRVTQIKLPLLFDGGARLQRWLTALIVSAASPDIELCNRTRHPANAPTHDPPP
jgi:hypothetical protein